MAVVDPTVVPDTAEAFRRTWEAPAGFVGTLSEVNNQPIGQRFMLTAFLFFLLGGVLALLLRVQLAVAENSFLGPQTYNQVFTMHGSTMMYLFAVPFLEGLALYLLPMLLGSRDVAYPRLTSFGWWSYLFGGVLFYVSFVFGAVPDVGWFGYTPLSGPRYSGLGTDFWLLGLTLVEFAGITAAVEIVVTVLKLRAPGMSLDRMPLFAWAILTAGVMILFAFTTLLVATILLELDRTLQTRFFDPQHGGSSLLWQHLFWFFGHPEVYIMFLPATGIVSLVVPVFARRPIVGYSWITVAIVLTGFVSFGLWVHHMFTTGLPELSQAFFTAASLMIALASGVQVFSWIATLWGSRPTLSVPLWFVLGFIFLFVLGGLTGVMVAVVPFDRQVHDTFFVVAHFHYVLIGGVVFPIFAALHYWLPKFTGRKLDRTLGLTSFWLTFVGFNLTFFPMHIMGFLGMPRRVYTYPAALRLDGYNLVATFGAVLLACGFVALVLNVLRSLRRGEPAGDNPWEADTLEWSISSPPPVYTWHTPPMVSSRHPLWDEPRVGPRDKGSERATQALAGAPVGWRATLVTDIVDAHPQAILHLPSPTLVPLLVALAVLAAAVGVLSRSYLLAGAGVLATVGGLIAWLWPQQRMLRMLRESTVSEEADLPIFTTGSRSVGWWGMVGLLTVLGVAFGVLVFSYFYIRLYSETWPQGSLPLPSFHVSGPAFGALLVSAGALFWASRGFHQGRGTATQVGLGGCLALGAVYLVLQLYDLGQTGFSPQANAYASLFHVIAGAYCLLVLVGLAVTAAAQLRAWLEPDDREGILPLQMQLAGLYWYFTVGVGVLVFGTLYVSPHVL